MTPSPVQPKPYAGPDRIGDSVVSGGHGVWHVYRHEPPYLKVNGVYVGGYVARKVAGPFTTKDDACRQLARLTGRCA